MKRFVLSICLLMTTVMISAQQDIAQEHKVIVKDAETLFESGSFVEAGEKYSQLLSIYPQNSAFNYKFGVCSVNNGNSPDISIRHLEYACKTEADVRAHYYLGLAYHLNYDFEDAIASFESFKKKADDKVEDEFDVDHQITMCQNGKSLMKNIKDLVVMDKKQSGTEDFYRYYELASMGGKLLAIPDELKSKIDKKRKYNGVLYYNGNSSEVYFASYGDHGDTGTDIYKAMILPNGKYSNPQKLKGNINTIYDEDFPFVHPDGKSLYFSSKGHSSMGGYDVFRSEMDPSTGLFGMPVNLDFAVNTPDDDILYVTDSLHKEAWFASGRNISTGQLNIYNVRVKGIPMNLIFLKGIFSSSFDSNLKNARITVRDELTNREVSDIYSDPETGEYVIVLNKPGLYKFEVNADNSPIIHEGLVQVPESDQSVAYSQELTLIKESNMEKLIIHNNFDQTLDLDLAELSKEILRKKSALDVNADEIDIPEEEEEIVVSIDKTLDNATLAAGFAEGITINDVVKDAQADLDQMEQEAIDMEDNNRYAYAYAIDLQEKAALKMKESRQIRESADPDDETAYANAMIEADRLLLEADEMAMNSKAAMRIAKRAEQISKENDTAMNEIEENIKMILEGELNQDFDKATEALRWEKDRMNAKKGIIATTPGELAKEESKTVEDEQTKILADIEELSSQESTLKSLIKRNDQNIANENKKNKLEQLEQQKTELQGQLDEVQGVLAEKRKDVRGLGKEQKLLDKEAEFYANRYIHPENINLNPVDLNSPSIAVLQDDSDDLAEEIDDVLFERNIQRSSGEYLMNGKPVTVATETLAETSAPDNTESAVETPQMDKKEKEALLTEASTINADIQRLETELLAIEQNEDNPNLHPDYERLRNNLKEKEVERERIKGDMNIKPLNEEGRLLVYQEFEPEYNNKIQDLIASNDSEVYQSIEIQAYKRQVRDELLLIQRKNNEQIQTEKDPERLERLVESSYKYDETLDFLNNEIRSVAPLRAAYEDENKVIVDSNEPYPLKLEKQIAVTNLYISSLDKSIEATELELQGASNPGEIQDLSMALNAFQEERTLALSKVENYNEDLALTTSTEDVAEIEDNTKIAQPQVNETPVEKTEETPERPEVEYAQPVNGGSFNEIFADAGKIKPEDAYFSAEYYEFAAMTEGTKFEIDNLDEIDELEDEIYALQERHKAADEEEKAKLDKEMEKKFVQVSKKELRNYAKMHQFTSVEMKDNAKRIDSLKTANDKQIVHAIIKNELKMLSKEIDVESDELEAKRRRLPDVMDDIEQGFVAREAFGLESSILRKQRKMIELYENMETLNELNESDIRDMNSGVYGLDEEIEEILVLNEGADINWKLIDQEGGLPELANSTMRQDLENKKSSKAGNPAYVDQLRNMEIRLSERSKMIADREDLKEEVAQLEADMETLEFKIANTSKKKEKEALQEEMRKLRAKADVIYDNIEYLTAELANNADDVVAMMTEDEQLAENKPAVKSTTIETPSTQEENPTEVRSVDQPKEERVAVVPQTTEEDANKIASIEEPVKSAEPVKAVERNADPNPVRNEVVERNEGSSVYSWSNMFNFPDYLAEDIFRMRSSDNAGDKDIPKNVKLPSGTVYKVQVGAFRNPIKSSVFQGFSPVTGETLNNGITRYTAGLFVSYENADEAKKQIRAMGYSDAFIVKFVDGKRVSISGLGGDDVADNVTTQKRSTTPVDKESSAVNEVKSDRSGKAAREYYESFENAADANLVEEMKGVFFTVQIGVYSRPVPTSELFNIVPVNAELLDGGKYRYSTGVYTDVQAAIDRKGEVRTAGVKDAFVTAYNNGRRITVAEAKHLLLNGQSGAQVPAQPKQSGSSSAKSTSSQTEQSNNTAKSSTNEKTSSNAAKKTTTSNNVETRSIEMESPVVVRTNVNKRSDGAEVRMIQMEYDILLYSTSLDGDINESTMKAINRFKDQFGVVVVKKGDKKLVHTKRVNTLQEARNIQNELSTYGVPNVEIRAFRIE